MKTLHWPKCSLPLNQFFVHNKQSIPQVIKLAPKKKGFVLIKILKLWMGFIPTAVSGYNACYTRANQPRLL